MSRSANESICTPIVRAARSNTIRVGEKGRLVIPAAMREAMGMKDGDVLDLTVVGGEPRIATMRERLRRAQENVRKFVPAGVSLADGLSAERREAAKLE